MSKLHQISVSLTQGQKEKLARAYRNKEGVSIRLKHSALSGSDVLMVPMNTVNRVAKHRNMGVGVQINISKNNIRKQTGSGIFSAVLPALRAVAPAIGKTLGLATLAGAAGEGASQIIKKISGGSSMRMGKGSPRIGRPPPFIGSWEGRGKKKKKAQKGHGLILGRHSPFNKIPIIGDIL